MNIVFILGSYYPKYSAVGKCMGNIADCMSKKHDVIVIAEQNIYGQQEEETYNGHRIIRVSTSAVLSDLRNDYLWSEKQIDAFTYRMLHQWNRYWRNARKLASPTTVDKRMVKAYLAALESIESHVDVIFPTCIPFTSVVAALKYKKNHSETQILPYLYDLFADNINLNINSFNQKVKRHANLKLELEMMRESKCVFHVENWTKHIDEMFPQYKSKSIQVEHPLLLDKRGEKCEVSDGLIHVVCTGLVDKDVKYLKKILEIIQNSNNSLISFDFYGVNGNKSVQDILETAMIENNHICYYGYTDNDIFNEKKSQADVLLLIGNKHCQQMQSELLESIATGKTIIYFAISLADPEINILNSYQKKLIIDLSSDDHSFEIGKFVKDYYKERTPFPQIVNLFKNEDAIVLSKKMIDGISNRDVYKVIFAGALRQGYVEADFAIKLFSHPYFENIKVTFYSAGTGTDVVNNCGNKNIELHGWISREDLENEYRNSDVLLSIAEKNGKQISSKIFDYMSFDKPIVHIYYCDDDVNLKYLRQYNNCILIRGDTVREKDILLLLLFLRTIDQRKSWPIESPVLLNALPSNICREIEKWIEIH